MRTLFHRIAVITTLACLSIAFSLPNTVHAAAPLLLKPTGSCPSIVTNAAPEAGSTDPAAPTATANTCGPDGLCVGTNIPCNYSLNDIKNTAVGIGNWIFGIIGVVVLAMFIYGGAVWLMSAGNSSSVEHGRAVMTGALIGLLLVFSAGAIVKVFLKTLGANPDIYNSLPLQGNSTGPDGGNPTGAETQLHTACSCHITGLSGPDVTAQNFTGKPDNPIVNVATCTAYYKKWLANKAVAEATPASGAPANPQIQQKYATYATHIACGVVSTQ